MSDIIRGLGIEINLTGNADDELRAWAQELREARSAALGFTDNINDLEKEMIESAKKIGLTEDQLKDLIKQTRQSREVRQFAEQYGFSMDQIAERTNNASSTIATFGTAVKALVAAGIVSKLFSSASEMVQIAARYEQTATSFEVMLGSAERARNVLQQITEFSNATPFTPEEVTASARSLMAMGVSAENLMTTMRMVGDVASGVGMNFNELAQIWGKNLASGTVQMEDLNQLAGRGIPIMKELSKVFFGNENQVQQVRELSSRGQISFRHLEQAFRNMTSRGGQYFGMMERQSHTAIGLWSTLTGNVDETKRQIGMMLMEALKPLLELLVKLTSWLVNTRWAMAALKVIFLAAIPIIIGIAVALVKTLIPTIIASTVAFWNMAVATIAATWPFMLIAAAIIALILIIEDLYVWIQGGDSLIGQWLGSFSEFGTKVKGIFIDLWEKIKSIFSSVINFFREKGKYFVMAIFPVSILYFYWDQITAFFRALPGRIVDFFTSIPDRLMSALSGLGARIRDALRGLLPNWALNLIARVSGPSTPAAVEARASGGPVSSGRAYIVGEEGPELFTPSQSGYIVPSVSLAGNGRNIVIAPVLNFNAPVRHEDALYVRDIVSRVLTEIASRIEGGVRAGLGLEVG